METPSYPRPDHCRWSLLPPRSVTRPFHSAVFRSGCCALSCSRTRHHLHSLVDPLHPPVSLRGLFWLFWLFGKRPKVAVDEVRRLWIVTTIRFSIGSSISSPLASMAPCVEVYFSPLRAQPRAVGFGLLHWDVLCSMVYHWRVARQPSRGGTSQYLRLWLAQAMLELAFGQSG